jgi:hypothetical protein
MKKISRAIWQYGWLLVASLTTTAQAKNVSLSLKDHAAIEFSDPIHGTQAKAFGPGWKTVTFVGADGQRTELMPREKLTSTGGAVFSGPEYSTVSPTGKYVVLSVVRAGVVDDPVAQSHIGNVASRQYCPVLVAKTGCLISIQTGGICGGQWDEKNDLWRVGIGDDIAADTAAMLKPQFPHINDSWNSFSKSAALRPGYHKLKDDIIGYLGVTNLLACEPPSEINRDAYVSIARQLLKEGDRADAAYIEGRLAVAGSVGAAHQALTITVDRAYLYDLPDPKAQSKMYLVRGDTVRLLDKSSEDWVRIEYARNNGAVIDKWIQSTSIKLP